MPTTHSLLVRAQKVLSQTLLVAIVAVGLVPDSNVQPGMEPMSSAPKETTVAAVSTSGLAGPDKTLPCMLCRYTADELGKNASTICTVGSTVLCGALSPRSLRGQRTCRIILLYGCSFTAYMVQRYEPGQACAQLTLCPAPSSGASHPSP